MGTLRLIVVAILVGMAGIGASSQDKVEKRLLCEGEYSKRGAGAKETSWVKLDRWQMYAVSDGSISVDVEFEPYEEKNLSVEEHLSFNKNLRPKAFCLVQEETGSNPKRNEVHCDYETREIRCRLDSAANEIHQVINANRVQERPFAFIAFGGGLLDFPWFMQSIVWQAERETGRKTAIPVIAMEDGESPESVILTVDDTEQVEYIGREEMEFQGQKLRAHRFRTHDAEDTEEFWFSESGLLLRETGQDGFEVLLTTYKGPSLTE